MKKSTRVRFVSHGVRIAVTSDSADTLGAVEPFLPPLRTPMLAGRVQRSFHLSSAIQADGRGVFSLYCGTNVLARSMNLAKVLGVLEWEVNLFVAQRAMDRIFVHSGAVEWNGTAILIPGRSLSGKSTLVAELVRAGCAYLSDEYAVLDSTGACHAYPRMLKLRVPDGIERRTVEELGGRTRSEPLPVGLVVVTSYFEGASWQPSRLSSGEAVLALLQNTVVARARAGEALAVLRAAMKNAEALEGPRGDAAELVHALLSARPRVSVDQLTGSP